jgi:hypothetical protein
MAIGKISGQMLFDNLQRLGVDLAIDGNLAYFDVTNRRVGISTSTPQYAFDSAGNARIANLTITNNQITSNTGKIALGSIANVGITGGSQYNTIYTDGSGTLAFGSLSVIAGLQGFSGNNLLVGTGVASNNSYGTNALTTGLTVADAIGLLDDILGNITNKSGNVLIGTLTTNSQPYINSVGTLSNVTVSGNAYLGNLTVVGNAITSNTGKIGLGSVSSIVVTGGNAYDIVYTDGAGNLAFGNLNTLSGSESFTGNNITLGSNSSGYLASNAVTLTTGTSVTNALAQLNYVLGKLVPASPPSFPGTTPLTLTTGTRSARICNFTQVDNAFGNTYQAAASTTVNAIISSAYATSTLTAVGPGDSGTVTVYWNGKASGANTLVGGANGTFSNLIISNNQDYHNVVSSVTAGFWYSFNAQASGTALPGWNTVQIGDSATGANTNPVLFYFDNVTAPTPTFSNVTTAGTNAVLTTNNVVYSSTVPHLTTGSTLRLKGNIAKLSGDFYYTSDTFMIGSAGGAWQAPTGVAYTNLQPVPATPLVSNLYVSSGSAYFETPSTLVASGFGSSSTGPSLTAYNGYTNAAQAFTTALGVTTLYKIGTSTNIEETSIPVTGVGTGSGNGYRIANPGSADTPAYTGSEAAFNSQTGPFYTYDATNVASGVQGVVKFDQTNYSTGYYPVGPNLSGQGASQYFTFKFVRTAVSKFNVSLTTNGGTAGIAGIWVAMPGQSDTYSGLNGWYSLSTAYAGSGIPGTGGGGNGSNGCAIGGVVPLNSTISGGSYTATFGSLSSTSATNNEMYVRIKLTSGQSISALSIVAATN